MAGPNAPLIVLTPNQRLAGYLQHGYGEWQAKQGRSEGKAPLILSGAAYWTRLWQDKEKRGEVTHRLLTPYQEECLWQKIISEVSEPHFTYTESMAQLAQEAWALIWDWQIALEPEAFSVSEETQHFYEWAIAFQSCLEKERWMTGAQLLNHFSFAHEKEAVPLILYGFIGEPPALQQLITLWKGEVFTPLPKALVSIGKVACASRLEEWQSVSRWAKAILQKEPKRVGIVVPDLHRHRKTILRIFGEVFKKSEFNISLGQPLIEYPLIETALLLLQIGLKCEEGRLTLRETSQILNSPFVGEAEQELCRRAELEAKIYASTEREVSWMLWQSIERKENLCPHLYRRVSQLVEGFASLPKNALASVWADIFREQLQTMGWPGERTLASDEYQHLGRWDELLVEFSKLDVPCGSLSFVSALQHLACMARQEIFQAKPEGEAGDRAPIQILGLLEAGGLFFDHLWVTGFSNERWPPPLKPHPFIPFQLQKEKQMPHASHERELNFCKRFMRTLVGREELIWSWPNEEEGRPRSPSSFIRDFPVVPIDAGLLAREEDKKQQIFQSQKNEYWRETLTFPIQPGEEVKGGAGILREQSACPFKAFATYRLKAKSLEPAWSLAKTTRGKRVHKALQMIWQRIRTQARLLAMPSEKVTGLLEEVVAGVFEKACQEQLSCAQALHLEKKYVESLLRAWLKVEEKRPPFEVVAVEQFKKVEIGPLALTLCVDRMDRLSDGSHLVIDYKIGRTALSQWFGERPGEPQLPLYAVVSQIPLQAVAFAAVSPEELRYKGTSEKNLGIHGIIPLEKMRVQDGPKEWDNLIHHWKHVLEKLATEFSEGVLDVMPKNRQTCASCKLGSLCRSNCSLNSY